MNGRLQQWLLWGIVAAIGVAMILHVVALILAQPVPVEPPAKYVTVTAAPFSWACDFDPNKKGQGDVVRGSNCRRVEVPE